MFDDFSQYYDYWDIGPSSVVYIFHKSITFRHSVLCGYEVQMNLFFFVLSESPSLKGVSFFYRIKINMYHKHVLNVFSKKNSP